MNARVGSQAMAGRGRLPETAMRATALSGWRGPEPGCFLVEMGGRRLLLGSGADPGPVDAVLLSHGAPTAPLPPAGAVWAAPPLGALGADVPGLRAQLPRRGRIRIAGLEVETGASGHGPGAVWIRIGGPGGLLYTGARSEEGALFPCDPLPQAGALIFDASYGLGDVPLAVARDDLLALAADGPLLLPAPAVGHGLEMALQLHAAGHVPHLCPEHLRAAHALLACPDWLVGGAAPLRALLAAARPLSDEAAPAGVMIAAGAHAEGGLSAPLAARFIAAGGAQVVFTAHPAQGTPAFHWVGQGAARFLRWNVHPRLSALRAALRAVAPRVAMPAFCTDPAALRPALPGVPLEGPVLTW
ncbi:hypothetical protein [Falsirhodobacter algicola]|uniref:Uncharacterized protein n=1 Tax=Falsirhodobacter algicola TaxID=2692330 RepID=A0A8J8SM40_9RHOB|nr:hypothetical protein [Falsirhodobacter algicola]QUS37064.1 hypothetical protein GR316_11785 [Falsirhodobacter algicola]